MSILINVLLATAIVGGAILKPQAFVPFRNYAGEYQLNIDVNSFDIISDGISPLVLMDIQIIIEKPIKYIDTPILVKSYKNSVAIDCRKDRLFIIVGRAFSTKDVLIYSTSKPEMVNNAHELGSPTTELIDSFCPLILDLIKEPRSKINTTA